MQKKLGVVVKKADAELRIVTGEVYAPNVPDSQGDFMLADDIRKMAHDFIRSLKSRKVDVNHDNDLIDASIVESFIAREDDQLFIPGSWVVSIKIDDLNIFQRVKDGEINGFSMEASVIQVEQDVILEIPPVIKGDTQKDHDEGHDHTFEIRFDNKGNFLGGETNKVDDHSHTILRASATEKADGHSHRFSFMETLFNANSEIEAEETD